MQLAGRTTPVPFAARPPPDRPGDLPAFPDELRVENLQLPVNLERAEAPHGWWGFGSTDPWPTMRGPVLHQFGTSGVIAPKNFTKALAWKWQHPKGRYQVTLGGGPTVDAAGNVYITASDGIRKISPTGLVLWHHVQADRAINNAPSLHNGKVLCVDEQAVAFALDQASGKVVWERKLAKQNGPDAGYPAACDGVFVASANSNGQGLTTVLGLDVETGKELWSYKPDLTVWDFAPQFPPGERVVFNDRSGGMYSLKLKTGKVLWKTPNAVDGQAFGDGGATLGLADDVFVCTNPHLMAGEEGSKGLLRRLRLGDGKVMWDQKLPQPCNAWPAVGFVGPYKQPSVVVAAGALMEKPNLHGSIMAFDAVTGKPRWRQNLAAYNNPPYYWGRGDEEGLKTRQAVNPKHPVCMPAHWSSPVIDGAGVVHAGRADGFVYSVTETWDTVSPLKVDKDVGLLSPAYASTHGLKVKSWDAGACFLHGAIGFGQKRMFVSSCDTLYAFNA